MNALPLVFELEALDASPLALVGGKASNLGAMIRAGLPVPPGFCVTTEAYRRVAASAAIDFDALASPDPPDLMRLAAAARDSLLVMRIPAEIFRRRERGVRADRR